MNETNFTFWLQGYFELTQAKDPTVEDHSDWRLTTEQVNCIINHAKLVKGSEFAQHIVDVFDAGISEAAARRLLKTWISRKLTKVTPVSNIPPASMFVPKSLQTQGRSFGPRQGSEVTARVAPVFDEKTRTQAHALALKLEEKNPTQLTPAISPGIMIPESHAPHFRGTPRRTNEIIC